MVAIIAIIAAFASSASALLHGVDSSTLVSTATYTKAKGEGFTKAIMRGYQQVHETDIGERCDLTAA
jgi:hypothetical protein